MKKDKKTKENQTRVNLKISHQILEKTKETILELNIFYENFEKNAIVELQKNSKNQSKKFFKPTKDAEKLTVKSFTEAAILYAIKHKIDPRFFQDESISSSINRLRNHILGFIVTQENKLIRPFQQDIIALKNDVSSLKKNVDFEKETIEETALETQGTLMGLAHVLFEVLQVDNDDRPKLEILLQKKGIEFIKNMQK